MSFQDILTEFAKDDLIYYFLPIFFLALAVEWQQNRQNNLELFETNDTKASLLK